MAACDNPLGTACTLEARPALRVEIVDRGTDEPIANGARVVARDGEYVDSVEVPTDRDPAMTVGLAHERTGTYTIEIDRDGYAAWAISDIPVDEDACHVETVDVTARLEPADTD